ncbi:MAG: FG-GAP-like repeat-containing protein [Planctomycetaceae bacterium]
MNLTSDTNATRKRRRAMALLAWTALLALAGCDRFGGPSSPSAAPDRSVTPLRAMHSAIRKADWQAAWKLKDAVLLQHGDDADVLVKVAQVAYETKHLDEAAELLVDANRTENFEKPQRVQQAMIAMIAAGRLFDGIAMLTEAIQKQPQQHDTRRWLFDFLIGTENRFEALPHGRLLVKQRQFDIELLTSLSNTEQRTQDPKPLAEMLALKPDDPRPSIGQAKIQFDSGLLSESIKTLQSIVSKFPDQQAAQVLLGRALATSGRYDELELWAKALSGNYQQHAGYWITVGDWARSKQAHAEAARAYWEACQRDPDVMESWTKLSATLNHLQSQNVALPQGIIEAANQRLSQLSRFHQLKGRFVRTGSISRSTVLEMVKVLRELGRLWEAEAWAAIATTLPEDPSVPIEAERQSIVAQLRDDTPWQLADGHPELQISLASLPLPSIGPTLVADAKPTSMPINRAATPTANVAALASLGFENEATERGVRFFGRTGDNLDKPGIPLYMTLGCGGGAIDFDLDGWVDLYLCAAGGIPPGQDSESNAMLRNLAGKYTDVTSSSSTDDKGFGQGVAVGDINEDGFPDLLLLNYGPNRLWINNGDGTFADRSADLGANSEWSTSGAIADLNGDGVSDLVVVNYCAGLDPVTVTCPMEVGGEARSCSPVKFPAQADVFFEGTVDGDLIDRTQAWTAVPAVLGRGLGITVGSLDTLPGIDVLVANDMSTNHYWSAVPGDEFRLIESAMPRGLAGDGRSLAQGSMGIATADLDEDGDIDFYVTNFDNEYNTFYEQHEPGIWRDQTAALDLASPTLPLVGFGTEAIDLENDGRWELIVTNGHVDLFQSQDKRSIYAQPMQIFRRTDEQKYVSIAQQMPGEYLQTPHVGRALFTLDANRDGLTDAVVTHQTEPVALLVNQAQTDHHFLEVCLVGKSCARDAIGATVELTVGETTRFAAQVSGDGYECSNERVIHFGISAAEKSDPTANRMLVRWPDGSTDSYSALELDKRWLLVQGEEAFALPGP